MKVYIDPDECTGCELCVATCSEVFSMADEGVAVAIDGEVPEEAEPACKEAVADCPAEAISVKE